jgi:hypothetical protein
MQFEGSPLVLRGEGVVHHAGGVIDVSGGGTLTIGESLLIRKTAGRALRINGSLALTGTATIDVVDGAIVTDYASASPLNDVRAKIVSGYNNGSWDGTGIRSSTAAADDNLALGYAEASAIFTSFPATFAGEQVDASAVLVLLTRGGDADLDGLVNLADFNRLAAGFGSTGALWDDGDFNYDGNVNLDDFNRLAANFGQTAAGPGVTPQDWANLAAAIPEPAAGVAAAALGWAALLARRRRILR